MADRRRPPEETRSGLHYLTQAGIAKQLGVTGQTIGMWLLRHPDSVPQADALVEGRPLWLVDRIPEWRRWAAQSFQ